MVPQTLFDIDVPDKSILDFNNGSLYIKPFSISEDMRENWLKAFHRWTNIQIIGCWEWTGRIHQHKNYIRREGYKGYPSIWCSAHTSTLWAHRVAYALFNGPIKENMHIDHKCRNTICVRPNHLQQVTPIENTRAIFTRKREDKWLKMNERQMTIFNML